MDNISEKSFFNLLSNRVFSRPQNALHIMTDRLHKKLMLPIQFFLFICFFMLCPLVYSASGIDGQTDLPAGQAGEIYQQKQQFKNAVSLIDNGSYDEAETILSGFIGNPQWQDDAYFLLGRLYAKRGYLDKAEHYFGKAVNHPLLKDYALKYLADIYSIEQRFDEALKSSAQIQTKILMKEVKKIKIRALLELKKEDEAEEALYQYMKEYPGDWDTKLTLARLLKKTNKRKEAVKIFKDIYISAAPLSMDALGDLKAMNEDKFTLEEILGRAENLFKKGNFPRAEVAYKKAFKYVKSPAEKNKIRFSIGMCQFRQKQYSNAAKSFELIKDSEAAYWTARSFYRINDMTGFNIVMKKFEEKYPGNNYLAKLLIMLANEQKKEGELIEAEETFKRVISEFPSDSEDALWGLGWMNYTKGKYEEAVKYFSALTSSAKNDAYYRYLYWKAKSRDMIVKNCIKIKADLNTEDDVCAEGKDDKAYEELLGNTGYYGFMLKRSMKALEASVREETTAPVMPDGEIYKRIELLKFFGMNKEAVEEIKTALKNTKNPEEFRYLGFSAIDAGEYKSIIYFVEGVENRELLPLAYPRGYRETVVEAAKNEGIDPLLVFAIIREESRFDSEAVSIAGAFGLMQLMPSTARRINRDLKIELSNNSDLFDVRKNIPIGTHYLSLLLEEFKDVPLAVAAYNAGENAVRKWLLNSNHREMDEFIEDIPYNETKKYVKNVLKSYWRYRTIEGLSIREEKL
ncbi:MAG: transglycosylase SLT domain-containing protein [Nitrospirota bacterium]